MFRSDAVSAREAHARDLDRLLARAEAALIECRWDDAELALTEAERADRGGRVEILTLFRALDECRGKKERALPRFEAFALRHPSASSPDLALEHALALLLANKTKLARQELTRAMPLLDSARSRATAQHTLGASYLDPFDAKKARQAFGASAETARGARILDLEGSALLGLGIVELRCGELVRAARLFRQALDIAERGEAEGLLRLAHYQLGDVLARLGRNRAGGRHLEMALTLAERRNEPSYAAWARLALADIARRKRNAALAASHLERAEALLGTNGSLAPTETAWIGLRRAELILLRRTGRFVEEARAEARHGLRDGVERTPQLLCRLLLATLDVREQPTVRVGKALSEIATVAETHRLVDIAWRARALSAKNRLLLETTAWVEGRPLPPLAALEAARAKTLLETTLGSMRRGERAIFLRDPSRQKEARWLARAACLATAPSGQPLEADGWSAARRAAWLRVVELTGKLAMTGDPDAVVTSVLAALLEVTGAERAFLSLDASADAAVIEAGLDSNGQRLPWPPPRARKSPTRDVLHDGRRVGALLLEKSKPLRDDLGELAQALANFSWPIVEGARARAALLEVSRAREREAERLELDLRRAEKALFEARSRTPTRIRHRGMLGRSSAMQELFARLERIERSDLPVLITGESGTGKELVARAIHDGGKRVAKPFIALNCGAIPESLLESELFGHVRGAFTGAERDHHGLFVVANGGTLFLDEIAEMSLAMQAKLLRVLQEHEVRPIGGILSRAVDVRVLCATHQSLHSLVREKRFREDLLYRLEVLTVHVPPLRARDEDILLLARQFLAEADTEKKLSTSAAAWLVGQRWPGNVRELKATIEAAAVLATGTSIEEGDLVRRRDSAVPHARSQRDDVPLRMTDLEAWAIVRALERSNGALAAAARTLGIGRATLYRKMVTYGISRPHSRPGGGEPRRARERGA